MEMSARRTSWRMHMIQQRLNCRGNHNQHILEGDAFIMPDASQVRGKLSIQILVLRQRLHDQFGAKTASEFVRYYVCVGASEVTWMWATMSVLI